MRFIPKSKTGKIIGAVVGGTLVAAGTGKAIHYVATRDSGYEASEVPGLIGGKYLVTKVEFKGSLPGPDMLKDPSKRRLDGEVMYTAVPVGECYDMTGLVDAEYVRVPGKDEWFLAIHGEPGADPKTGVADSSAKEVTLVWDQDDVTEDMRVVEEHVKRLQNVRGITQVRGPSIPVQIGEKTYRLARNGFELDRIQPYGAQVAESEYKGFGAVQPDKQFTVTRAVFDTGDDPHTGRELPGGFLRIYGDNKATPEVDISVIDAILPTSMPRREASRMARSFIGQELSVAEKPKVAEHNHRHFVPADQTRIDRMKHWLPKYRRAPGTR